MKIHDDMVKCVAFILVGVQDEQTGKEIRKPVATCFFVGVSTDNFFTDVYAITARHVIDGIRSSGKGYIRFNRIDGGSVDYGFDPHKCLESLSSDVAVVVLRAPEGCDFRWIPMTSIATAERLTKDDIGIGDEVFFVSLFSEFPGYERNQPILRFGNISLMPREKLHLRLSPGSHPVPVSAYLVESISWGGESGSPAFVFLGVDRAGYAIALRGGESHVYLLGLVHGHYPMKTEVDFTGDFLGSATVDLNAGMAVVIPAQDIVDLLMREEVVKDRNKALEEYKKGIPIPRPNSSIADRPFTRDDFMRDLNKVVRKKSAKDTSKSDEESSPT